jgi:hypothetical protein
MTMTVVPVGPHGFVGPGIPVNLGVQGIPIPGSSFWELTCSVDPEGLQRVFRIQRPTQGSSVATITPLNLSFQQTDSLSVIPQAGDQVHYIARLMDGTTQLASLNITAEYQVDPGLGQQAFEIGQVLNAKPTGGLTQPQADQLLLASQSKAAASMAIGVGPLIGYAASVVSQLDQVPYYFLCSVDATDDVQGEGELAVPTLARPSYTAGISWSILHFPPGTGQQIGAAVEFQGRMLQTVTRYRLHANQGPILDGDIRDWNVHNLIYLFDPPLPSFLAYHIRPGVHVKFFWLQVCLV